MARDEWKTWHRHPSIGAFSGCVVAHDSMSGSSSPPRDEDLPPAAPAGFRGWPGEYI